MSDEYVPQAWRMTGYYPESYAKFMAALGIGIDYSDDDFDRYEAEFRADLAAHDAEVRSESLADMLTRNRVAVVAEEQEGRRWFTAAYRARNGSIIPIGDETVVREHAQKTVNEFSREDANGPAYFLASRVMPPWLPVSRD